MIFWDEIKNRKLISERNISFERIADIILEKKYLDIVHNPSRPDQLMFIIEHEGYIYAVPFVIDEQNICLKTAYPSRKFHKLYGDII